MDKILNYYETLHVPHVASQAVIAQAYRNLARLHHPDRSTDKALATEKMVAINKAYSILRYPERRKEYDDQLARLSTLDGITHSRVVYSAGTGMYSTTNVAPQQQSSNSNFQSAIHSHDTPGQPRAPAEDTQRKEEDETIERAEFALHQGQYATVIALCKSFLIRQPSSRRALELLGDAYAHTHDIDGAGAAYLSALHIAPKDSRLRSKLERLKASSRAHSHPHADYAPHGPKTSFAQPARKPELHRPHGPVTSMVDAIKGWFR